MDHDYHRFSNRAEFLAACPAAGWTYSLGQNSEPPLGVALDVMGPIVSPGQVGKDGALIPGEVLALAPMSISLGISEGVDRVKAWFYLLAGGAGTCIFSAKLVELHGSFRRRRALTVASFAVTLLWRT